MRIAIIGYYGHNNLGDELNLFEMLRLIDRQYPKAEVTVFSGGLPVLYYEPDYPLVLADTMTLEKYQNALNSFDLVLIGGGGLIFLGANYFNFLTEKIQVPYLFCRVGVDDRVISKPACEALKKILSRARSVTVRTSADRELVSKHLGIDCQVVPEAIWNYQAKPFTFMRPGRHILVSINGYASEYEPQIAEALAKLKTPHAVYTVSMQDTADDFYHNIKSTPGNRIILPESVGLHKKASFLAASDLVITSRLHAGLISISHGVPPIMLKSTPKVKNLMEDLQLTDLYCDGALNEEIIESVLSGRETWKATLLEQTKMMRNKASANLIP